MQFGLFGGAAARLADIKSERQLYTRLVDYVCEAEQLGFRSFFLAEHHFSGISQISSSLQFLTFVAARTRTIRLGTAVTVLPWHNPALLAEQISTLDLMSNGRLDLGIGRGYRRSEFDGFCIPFEEAWERYGETLDFLKAAWSATDRFSFHGKNWDFENIVVEPSTVQKPHPPLWVGAGSRESLGNAADQGFNLLLDQIAAPAVISDRMAVYRDAVEAAGRVFDPMSVGVTRAYHLARDQAAREAAYRHRASFLLTAQSLQRDTKKQSSLGLPSSMDEIRENTERAGLIGDPAEIVGRLRELESRNVEYVLMMDVTLSIPALRTFAREVMPEFRAHLSASPVA